MTFSRNGWSALALRAIVGCGFMAHGLAKLSKGPVAFAGLLHALGVPAPHVMAWATILVEILGGVSVLIGAYVWVATVPMVVVLLVAMFTVHLQYGFSSIKLVAVTPAGAQFGPPGYEVDLLYIACLAALVIGGSGPFSVDAVIARRALRSKATAVWVALVAAIALGMTGTYGPVVRLGAAAPPRFKAVAFDYFVLFNPDSIVSDVEAIFPGQGRELTNRWRGRQFEYSWLRSITGRYVDFSAVTEDALVFAARTMKLEPTPEQKRRLLDAYLHLSPWPDTVKGLRRLRESGVRVVTIANFSPVMLRSNAEQAGISGLFDALVSTDANHTYKPDPRAYQLGINQLRLSKDQIVFAAFGGWDAAGAKSFGYPTVWVNRFAQPLEELGVRPDRTVSGLEGLLEFVLGAEPSR
jgi:2-haloacid dehalogenase